MLFVWVFFFFDVLFSAVSEPSTSSLAPLVSSEFTVLMVASKVIFVAD